MVSGRLELKVSGRNSTIEPESTEMPPNNITGSDGIMRACKPKSFDLKVHAHFTESTSLG